MFIIACVSIYALYVFDSVIYKGKKTQIYLWSILCKYSWSLYGQVDNISHLQSYSDNGWVNQRTKT